MTAPVVGIIMGSKSDWATMEAASKVLTELGVAHESRAGTGGRATWRDRAIVLGAIALFLAVIAAVIYAIARLLRWLG